MINLSVCSSQCSYYAANWLEKLIKGSVNGFHTLQQFKLQRRKIQRPMFSDSDSMINCWCTTEILWKFVPVNSGMSVSSRRSLFKTKWLHLSRYFGFILYMKMMVDPKLNTARRQSSSEKKRVKAWNLTMLLCSKSAKTSPNAKTSST